RALDQYQAQRRHRIDRDRATARSAERTVKPGLIEITDSRRSADLANFRITCQPHVAIKLRRMFGGIQRTQKAGVFEIAATPGRAYELDWFRKLHPLDVHPDAQRQWSKLV